MPRIHRFAPLLLLSVAGLVNGQTDATAVTYTGLPIGPGTGGTMQNHVSDSLYPHGYALDFCGTVNVNGVNNNTTCLQYALNALGGNFTTLEIQPPVFTIGGSANATVGSATAFGVPVITSASFQGLVAGDTIQMWQSPATSGPYYQIQTMGDTTSPPTVLYLYPTGAPSTGTYSWSFQGTTSQVNYVCSSLAWNSPAGTPTALGRVHVWKGANLTCALPPPDSMHVVVDDNVQPITPFASTALPPGTNVTNAAWFNGSVTLMQHVNSALQFIPMGGAVVATDLVGTIKITSGTAVRTFTFFTAYASPPACVVTPQAEPSPTTLKWWVETTTTTMKVKTSAATTAALTFNYICMGNPN